MPRNQRHRRPCRARTPELPDPRARAHDSEDDLPSPPTLSLPLRVLALVGALSFVMIGLTSLVPLLRPPPPRPLPDLRQGPIT